MIKRGGKRGKRYNIKLKFDEVVMYNMINKVNILKRRR
jgi:hypothetical protein